VTRYCPGFAPRAAGIAARITDELFIKFDPERSRRAESSLAATTRVRVGDDGRAELGRKGASESRRLFSANLGADPNVDRGVLASRGLPDARADDAVEGVRGE
jgi:hypothetical protein